jgi:3-methyladenine DNA glycosylase AlkD
MARFGINPHNTFGVPVSFLRQLARAHRRNHSLAVELWQTGIHEARILAAYTADPEQLTEAEMDAWVKDFDSWDVCDQVCGNLFDKTPIAYAKAREWCVREEEFVKRAGFVLMTQLAVHDKKAPDGMFVEFLSDCIPGARDERNFVKKAVNWALRQIGKRSHRLHQAAIKTARLIQKEGTLSGRWIAADALRELARPAVQQRLANNFTTETQRARRKT